MKLHDVVGLGFMHACRTRIKNDNKCKNDHLTLHNEIKKLEQLALCITFVVDMLLGLFSHTGYKPHFGKKL